MKPILLFIIFSLIGIFYFTDLHRDLSLENIQANLQYLVELNNRYPIRFLCVYAGIFIFLTSLSIPGTIVLTLLSGALFGVLKGALIVTISCSIGASIAFLLSRYLFKDFIMTRYRKRFQRMDSSFRKNGISYLFMMRLIPISPFVCINILMGLTNIRIVTFMWVTFLGMLPGTSIYVFAGKKISQIDKPSEILTPEIVILLSLIALIPFSLKKLVELYKKREGHYGNS